MKVHRVEEGTEEWKMRRQGRITGSSVQYIFQKEGSKGREEFKRTLAMDLQGLERFDEGEAAWAEHGKEMEPSARLAYEWRTGLEVENNLIIVHDNHFWLSCSPDGLSWAVKRGLELKSHKFTDQHGIKHYDAALDKQIPASLADYSTRVRGVRLLPKPIYLQIQVGLAITGWERWDLADYTMSVNHQIQKLKIRPVYRDEHCIAEIILRGEKFMEEVVNLAQASEF